MGNWFLRVLARECIRSRAGGPEALHAWRQTGLLSNICTASTPSAVESLRPIRLLEECITREKGETTACRGQQRPPCNDWSNGFPCRVPDTRLSPCTFNARHPPLHRQHHGTL